MCTPNKQKSNPQLKQINWISHPKTIPKKQESTVDNPPNRRLSIKSNSSNSLLSNFTSISSNSVGVVSRGSKTSAADSIGSFLTSYPTNKPHLQVAVFVFFSFVCLTSQSVSLIVEIWRSSVLSVFYRCGARPWLTVLVDIPWFNLHSFWDTKCWRAAGVLISFCHIVFFDIQISNFCFVFFSGCIDENCAPASPPIFYLCCLINILNRIWWMN